MDKRRMYQWLLLAIISLSFSMGESYAQKKDFANLARYSKQNAAGGIFPRSILFVAKAK